MIAAAAWPKLLASDFASDDLGATPSSASVSSNRRAATIVRLSAKIIRESQARAVCTAPRAGCGRIREQRGNHRTLQHPQRTSRTPRPRRRTSAAHVLLRPHRLRLRPHRQLPHLPPRRRAAPLLRQQGIAGQSRHEHHRRRRQDHPQRRRRRRPHRASTPPSYEQAFFEDLDALGIERPSTSPAPPSYIPEMVALIEKLAAKDIAYQTEDGSWYFRIARFPDTASSRRKTSTASKTALASMSTSTRRTPPATSPCGRPSKPGEQSLGHARSAPAAPAGTSSAPPWP